MIHIKHCAIALLLCLGLISSCKSHKTFLYKDVKGNKSYSTSHTNKKYEKLRQQFLNSDDKCNCSSVFDYPEKYLHLSAFPRAKELNDSLINADYFGVFTFFEDDSIELSLNSGRNEVPIYIFYKDLFITNFLIFDLNSERLMRSFFYPEVGVKYKFDDLGNLLFTENSNYFESFKIHTSKYWAYISPADSIAEVETGEAIKIEYPLCFRQAVELAKCYAGKMLTEETSFFSSLDEGVPYWYFVSKEENKESFNDYVDYIRINAKDGKLFHRHIKTHPYSNLIEDEEPSRCGFIRWLRPIDNYE